MEKNKTTKSNCGVREKKVGWIGHTLRKKDDDITKQSMSWKKKTVFHLAQNSRKRSKTTAESMERSVLAANKVRSTCIIDALRFNEEQ